LAVEDSFVVTEIVIKDDFLAALGLDTHFVLKNKTSAGVISPEIDVSDFLENSRRSLLVLKNDYSEGEKGASREENLVGTQYSLVHHNSNRYVWVNSNEKTKAYEHLMVL